MFTQAHRNSTHTCLHYVFVSIWVKTQKSYLIKINFVIILYLGAIWSPDLYTGLLLGFPLGLLVKTSWTRLTAFHLFSESWHDLLKWRSKIQFLNTMILGLEVAPLARTTTFYVLIKWWYVNIYIYINMCFVFFTIMNRTLSLQNTVIMPYTPIIVFNLTLERIYPWQQQYKSKWAFCYYMQLI